MSRLLVLELDWHERAHLAVAIRSYARRSRAQGESIPPALVMLAERLAATSGQGRPQVAPPGAGAEDADVTPPALLVDYAKAGAVLGVSARTVRRCVAEGRLPAVSMGGRRLIHRADVEAFAESLRSTR